MSTPPFPDMDELVQRLLDDQIEPDEMQRLGKAIREDPRVRDYYVDSLLVSAVIRRSSQATGELSKSDLIQALSGGTTQGGSKRLRQRLHAVAALLVFGILVLVSLSLFRHKAQGPALGMLAGVYEAQWRGSGPRPGESLYIGSYDLRAGVAKMNLGRGTSLLLEAPCRVDLTSAGEVTLRNGRLAAVVLPQAKGFRVRTRTALITDLGTEFGVIAHSNGSTEAHVLKGHVTVALDPNRSGRATSLLVNEGQATAVDPSGRTIQGGLAARADLFLLQLPSLSRPSGPSGRLNLADIVGGGNGRGTGALERGIDLGTGQAFKGPATTIRRSRRNEFRPSPQLHGVDGVFVPNGALGPVVISSTGLTFSECPRTTGSYYGGPANSGKFYDIPSQQTCTVRLNGISLGTAIHPALTLHPNAGVTFDLDQIRQDNPDIRIGRFTAVCGIPKDLPRAQFSSADVWVLLDGVVRLHLHYPVERYVVEMVDVPIPAQTRFLTLVAACSGRADYSWIFFGDPFLE
ncbi:MAG: FecR domain-containing protein [Planctomycetes bacterium]|nr:FecR domain-containing protein [Planctomycetota bacterium]